MNGLLRVELEISSGLSVLGARGCEVSAADRVSVDLVATGLPVSGSTAGALLLSVCVGADFVSRGRGDVLDSSRCVTMPPMFTNHCGSLLLLAAVARTSPTGAFS